MAMNKKLAVFAFIIGIGIWLGAHDLFARKGETSAGNSEDAVQLAVQKIVVEQQKKTTTAPDNWSWQQCQEAGGGDTYIIGMATAWGPTVAKIRSSALGAGDKVKIVKVEKIDGDCKKLDHGIVATAMAAKVKEVN